MKFNIGLIGCGAWGRKYVNACNESSLCRLSMICSIHPDKEFPYGIVQTSSVDDVLNSGVHGVIIATPPDSHVSIGKKCLDRGIPFLLEKPIGLNIGECLELSSVSDHLNAPFQVNHIHLYSRAYLRLREIVNGWGNTTISIHSKGGNHGPFRSYDSLIDYGPHDISMILGLIPDHVYDSISINIDPVRTGMGNIFKIKMQGTNFNSTSFVGNGFDNRYRVFLVMNESTGDYVSYIDNYPDYRLSINGTPIQIDQTTPFHDSIVSFCNLISGQSDWRHSNRMYNKIYSLLLP